MKKFCLVSLAAIGLCLGACTESDRFFGNDLIPPSQLMTTRIDTLRPFAAHQITFDSISGRVVGATASSITPLGYVGSVIDPLVGRTTLGTLANFVPDAYIHNSDWQKKMFGLNPTADSMVLHILWDETAAQGDTAKKFKVSVYPINKRLHSGTSYYTCFDPTGFYEPSKPLLEFVTNGLDSVRRKLPTWYVSQFITPEYNIEGEQKPYSNDSVFLDIFKGLYFRTEPVAPGSRGALGAIDLEDSDLTLYYHNQNTAEKPDTTNLIYSFYYAQDNSAYYTPLNTSVVLASHDYSLATDPGRVDLAVINQMSVTPARLFVQGLGGLAVVASMDLSKLETLKEKAAKEGYRHVGVHRAELRWKVPERAPFYYDHSFPTLVLGNWVGSRSGIMPLPDYNPWNSSNANNGIGGALWRSVGYYSQDITSYIQQVLNGGNKNGNLILIPDFGAARGNLDPLRSVVVGSAGVEALRPELIVTYTLIR